jgi:hypothetical protein
MLHKSTFEYLEPTNGQRKVMAEVRGRFTSFAALLDEHLPEGPDKTYVLRKLREAAMWANISLTRNADGSPRTE